MLPSPFLRKVRYLSNLSNFERQTLVMLLWATDSRERQRQQRERGTRALWLLKETLNHLDCTSIKASKLQRQDAYIKVWKSIIHARHSKRLLWVPFSNTMTHNTTPVPFLNACASVLRPEWLHACLFLERGQLHLQTVQVCHTPTWLTCMSESADFENRRQSYWRRSRAQSLSPYAISISTQTLKKKVWMCSVVCYRVCLPKCLDSNVPGNALCYFLLSLWSSTTISSFARISWLRFVSTDGECYMCTSHHQQGDTYLSVFVSPTSVCYIFRNWKPVKAYCSIFSLLSFLHLYCWFTVFCFVFFTLVLAKCNHHMRIYKFSAGAEQLSAPKQQKHRDIAADSFTILL